MTSTVYTQAEVDDMVAGLTLRLDALTARVAKLEAPPVTPPVDPPPVVNPPASTPNTNHPFSAASPWNTPVLSTRGLEAVAGPKTSAMRNTPGMTPWINAGSYSVPVFIAAASDPLVTLRDNVHGTSTTARVPANAVPAAGLDSNMAIIQPDGTTIDVWAAHWTTPGVLLDVSRFARTSLTGTGLGPHGGIRGSGLSTLGGLIRRWEVDPTHPDYAGGEITHALALAIPAVMAKYTGGTSGYDANGYGTAKGYVWPATEQDWGSEYSYKGQINLGSLFTIPKSVDVTKLGLNSSVLAMAKAVQQYGTYVVDTTGSPGNTIAWYAEPSLDGTPWLTTAYNDWTSLGKLRAALVAAV